MLEAAHMPLLKVNVPPEVRRIAEEETDLTHSPGSSTVVGPALQSMLPVLLHLRTDLCHLAVKTASI